MIKRLINVKSTQRPTCDQILHSDIVVKWMKKLGLAKEETPNPIKAKFRADPHMAEDDGLGGNMSLLNTIKLPKNLKLLTDRLPKSQYEGDGQSSKGNLLSEVKSTKSLSDHTKKSVLMKGTLKKGTTAKEDRLPDDHTDTRGRHSSLSEERKLKRNASENLKKISLKPNNDLGMIIGGERLRDKNSHDYLETIRENE